MHQPHAVGRVDPEGLDERLDRLLVLDRAVVQALAHG